MKKCIPLIIFIFFFNSFLISQNMQIQFGATIENGLYISSNPLTEDDVYYYTKVGTPTLYLYRNTEILNLSKWFLGTTLGSADLATVYHFWQYSNAVTPDGLSLAYPGDLGNINDYPVVSDTPLPVELSSFTAEATDQGVLCNWTTESEIENLGFILERKTEGNEWIGIASYKTNDDLLGQGSISYATDYEYIDALVEPNTTYEYRLADVDYNGIVTYHATREVTVEQSPLTSMVEEFTVLPAYPNPFNPNTTIKYGLDDDSKVTIAIYDIAGNLISTLVNTEQTQGWHSVIWNGNNQQGELSPAGIYLSRITSDNEVKTTKLMLLK